MRSNLFPSSNHSSSTHLHGLYHKEMMAGYRIEISLCKYYYDRPAYVIKMQTMARSRTWTLSRRGSHSTRVELLRNITSTLYCLLIDVISHRCTFGLLL